ncbi:MAG: hypothetical protein OXK79_07285 [Chloroflexota bacterium]|nr:hypothetical protein [Chloroflexota bacterium]
MHHRLGRHWALDETPGLALSHQPGFGLLVANPSVDESLFDAQPRPGGIK